MRHVLLAVVLIGLAASSSPAQRLSGEVIPDHYTLWFATHLKAATFEGRTTLQARTTATSKSVSLHAAELTFGEVRITSRGRTQVARVTLDGTRETATLTVPEDI